MFNQHQHQQQQQQYGGMTFDGGNYGQPPMSMPPQFPHYPGQPPPSPQQQSYPYPSFPSPPPQFYGGGGGGGHPMHPPPQHMPPPQPPPQHQQPQSTKFDPPSSQWVIDILNRCLTAHVDIKNTGLLASEIKQSFDPNNFSKDLNEASSCQLHLCNTSMQMTPDMEFTQVPPIVLLRYNPWEWLWLVLYGELDVFWWPLMRLLGASPVAGGFDPSNVNPDQPTNLRQELRLDWKTLHNMHTKYSVPTTMGWSVPEANYWRACLTMCNKSQWCQYFEDWLYDMKQKGWISNSFCRNVQFDIVTNTKTQQQKADINNSPTQLLCYNNTSMIQAQLWGERLFMGSRKSWKDILSWIWIQLSLLSNDMRGFLVATSFGNNNNNEAIMIIDLPYRLIRIFQSSVSLGLPGAVGWYTANSNNLPHDFYPRLLEENGNQIPVDVEFDINTGLATRVIACWNGDDRPQESGDILSRWFYTHVYSLVGEAFSNESIVRAVWNRSVRIMLMESSPSQQSASSSSSASQSPRSGGKPSPIQQSISPPPQLPSNPPPVNYNYPLHPSMSMGMAPPPQQQQQQPYPPYFNQGVQPPPSPAPAAAVFQPFNGHHNYNAQPFNPPHQMYHN